MVEPGSAEDVADLDCFYRDPNGLNKDGRTLFHDLIGEPEGAHSAEWAWRASYRCFYTGKSCCYHVLTTLCAVPLAFCWGCQLACITFAHIWYVTPCFYIFNMNLSCVARIFATVVHCCCDPLYESAGLVFSRIHVHRVDNAAAYRSGPALEEMMMGTMQRPNDKTGDGNNESVHALSPRDHQV